VKTIADPPKRSLDGYHRAMGFDRRKMKDAPAAYREGSG